MKIIYDARQSGKTTSLIKLLSNNKKSILIVPFQINKEHLKEKYPELKNRIFSTGDVIYNGLRGIRYEEVYIDELEVFLRAIFHCSRITASQTEIDFMRVRNS